MPATTQPKSAKLHHTTTQRANMEKTFDIKEELKKLPDAPGVLVTLNNDIASLT